MGSEYSWGENLFRDYIIELVKNDVDVTNKEIIEGIASNFKQILQYFLNNSADIVYLNFNIKKYGERYKIIANNMMTALWLSGVYVASTDDILNNNHFIFEGKEYNYIEKTKKLGVKYIDE